MADVEWDEWEVIERLLPAGWEANSPWCKWSPLRSRLWWSSVM